MDVRKKDEAFVSQFWTPQHNSGFGAVLEPHLCGVKKEVGGAKRPHDAHDAGSWGAAGRLKYVFYLTKTAKYTPWAVFVVVNTNVGSMRCMTSMRKAWRALPGPPYKLCMLHGFWVRLAHISRTFVAPKLRFCTTLAYQIR